MLSGGFKTIRLSTRLEDRMATAAVQERLVEVGGGRGVGVGAAGSCGRGEDVPPRMTLIRCC